LTVPIYFTAIQHITFNLKTFENDSLGFGVVKVMGGEELKRGGLGGNFAAQTPSLLVFLRL